MRSYVRTVSQVTTSGHRRTPAWLVLVSSAGSDLGASCDVRTSRRLERAFRLKSVLHTDAHSIELRLEIMVYAVRKTCTL